MNQPSLDKFEASVAEGGIVVARLHARPAHPRDRGRAHVRHPRDGHGRGGRLQEAGEHHLAGKLFAETRFCEEETLWKAIEKCVPAKKTAMLDMNKRALQLGIDA